MIDGLCSDSIQVPKPTPEDWKSVPVRLGNGRPKSEIYQGPWHQISCLHTYPGCRLPVDVLDIWGSDEAGRNSTCHSELRKIISKPLSASNTLRVDPFHELHDLGCEETLESRVVTTMEINMQCDTPSWNLHTRTTPCAL